MKPLTSEQRARLLKKYGLIEGKRKPYNVVFKFSDKPFDADDGDLMGSCLYNAREIEIYLHRIKTPMELFDTQEHEDIHAANEDEDFFWEEEHRMIDIMAFMKHDMYTPVE